MATSVLRRACRVLTDPRGWGVAGAAPRTAAFMMRQWSPGPSPAQVPALSFPSTVGLAAEVLLDEIVISAMRNPKLFPEEGDYARAAAEMGEARRLWEAEGWLESPRRYHQPAAPPGLVSLSTERRLGQRFQQLSYESPYRPWPREPGRRRWLAHLPNQTAVAYMLRHPGGPRPWLVCIHGFGMGRVPLVDLWAFRAQRLHHQLGLNLILPVLPLHGPRQDPGADRGEGLMSINLIDTLHGMAQAAADVRAAIAWIRQQHPGVPVGVYGISLGGYVAALLAGLEDGLACVVAGIPATDMPDLYDRHSPPGIRRRARQAGALGPQVAEVMSVVSPLALPARLPRERLFVFGGLGDRMSSSDQAARLWEHWGRPAVAWYPGGHIGFFWSNAVNRFIDGALVDAGLASATDLEAPRLAPEVP